MKKQLIICVLLAWALGGCALLDAAQPAASDDVLARVNGVSLTRSELNTRMALAEVASWLANGGALPEMDEDQYVDKWIDSELMAQAAASANVSATREETEADIAHQLAAARLDETDLLRQLSIANLTRDEFVTYDQRAVAVQKFINAQVIGDASEIEKPSKLLTWLVRQRASAQIEKPTPATPKSIGVYAGAIAPDFTVNGMDGAEQSLAALRGKVVLVNFWATWCVPCRQEMPAIQAAYDAHKDEGFAVVGIDERESSDDVRAYAGELGLRFPLFLDADGKVGHQYRVFGLPTSVFVGRDGVIRQVTIGEMDLASLDANLKKMLY